MDKLVKNKEYFTNSAWASYKVADDMSKGLNLLAGINNKMITFFGSHSIPRDNENYIHCFNTAYMLGKKGYAILSGGGPGMMHAANSGAMKAGVPSIGLRADLILGELVDDEIYTAQMSFHYLFVRRFILAIKSEALIFYPGGFGTLNELFEYIVLIQTAMTDKVPIICVNRKYWNGLFEWLRDTPLIEKCIKSKDMDLIHVVDNIDEILNIIEDKFTT